MRNKLFCGIFICAVLLLKFKNGIGISIYDNAAPVNTTIVGGPYHFMAIKSDGALVSWGDNQWGALGRAPNYPDTPADAARVIDNAVSVSTYTFWSLAIDNKGGLWAWGSHMYGTFDGFKEKGYDYDNPVKIMDGVASISAGNTILVVKKDRSLWGWGAYYHGQLGDGRCNKYLVDGTGEPNDRPTFDMQYEDHPVKIMDDVCYSLSDGGTFVIKTDGSLWAWGFNGNGELGDGTTTTRTSPVKIMEEVKFIAPGPYAVKTDGSLWTWGLGDNRDENEEVEQSDLLPKKIMDNVIFASRFDGGQSVAVKEDGSFWIWGKNDFGQLGDGTTINRNEPTKIMEDVVYAAGNTFSTLALKKDGSLWHMGLYNDAGGSPKYLPHKVMDNIMLPKEISFSDAETELEIEILH